MNGLNSSKEKPTSREDLLYNLNRDINVAKNVVIKQISIYTIFLNHLTKIVPLFQLTDSSRFFKHSLSLSLISDIFPKFFTIFPFFTKNIPDELKIKHPSLTGIVYCAIVFICRLTVSSSSSSLKLIDISLYNL